MTWSWIVIPVIMTTLWVWQVVTGRSIERDSRPPTTRRDFPVLFWFGMLVQAGMVGMLCYLCFFRGRH